MFSPMVRRVFDKARKDFAEARLCLKERGVVEVSAEQQAELLPPVALEQQEMTRGASCSMESSLGATGGGVGVSSAAVMDSPRTPGGGAGSSLVS